MVNRTEVVRRVAERVGFPCSEALARHYESEGLLPDPGAEEYPAKLQLILSARKAGQSMSEVRAALGVPVRKPAASGIDWSALTGEQVVSRVIALVDAESAKSGEPRTAVALRLMSEDRELYAAYRSAMKQRGRALVAREGGAE